MSSSSSGERVQRRLVQNSVVAEEEPRHRLGLAERGVVRAGRRLAIRDGRFDRAPPSSPRNHDVAGGGSAGIDDDQFVETELHPSIPLAVMR